MRELTTVPSPRGGFIWLALGAVLPPVGPRLPVDEGGEGGRHGS